MCVGALRALNLSLHASISSQVNIEQYKPKPKYRYFVCIGMAKKDSASGSQNFEFLA